MDSLLVLMTMLVLMHCKTKAKCQMLARIHTLLLGTTQFHYSVRLSETRGQMIKALQLVLQKIRMPKKHLKKIKRLPRKAVRMQSSMPRLLD